MAKLRKKKGSVSFSNEITLTKSSNLNKLRTNSIEKKKRESKTNKTQERTASIKYKIKNSNNTINSNHEQTLKKNNETNLLELEFVCDVDAERSLSNRKKNNVKNESIKTGRVENFFLIFLFVYIFIYAKKSNESN